MRSLRPSLPDRRVLAAGSLGVTVSAYPGAVAPSLGYLDG